ncbi:triose-phosphate isomerase family protein [Rhizosaccharibacter radicis]|uniref:Triosephosphate isomerase n=1 Tax=Rhizosaccharibacter radicis TaxID=2782605 RepID=A0ABT1VUP9_9PROT|nr:triose-phosphate isomerase [Acetobacteraceae bacterium KSS12]
MSGRTRLVGVSLKMYMGLARTREWMDAVAAAAREGLPPGVGLFVIPGFLSLRESAEILDGTGVALGAQNMFWEDAGAFTGEVSAPMLREAGCRYVEIGHAERRRLFGETEEVVSLKMRAAIRNGLVPVLCIGEMRRGTPEQAVAECAAQFASAAEGLPAESELVFAWEPVWAIGAAEPAPPDYIAAVAGGLRTLLAGWPRAKLIYGGSAGPGLLTRLGDAVDGLFLGRFAHDVGALRQVLTEAAASAGPAVLQ